MSSEIQFGDLEQSEPQRARRPDQDAHFATAMVGEIGPEELLIFADLDVVRDMEAHALSNTRVELGGVMLGHQLIDEQGRPFVVVTDSLRAEHYEATKGSFKFTHQTWSQISRQREQFHPELEMVGWYHTHPGWSVFLSGMDLFICNNFFNRPLDVALVIDPCEQDRGWFQWNNQTPAKTQRTGGFILTTGRFRQQELDHFARIYNKEPNMNLDPRYSASPMGNSQPAVTLMDNRKPIFELAILGMLMMQFLFVAVVAWQLLAPSEPATAEQSEAVTELKSEVAQLTDQRNRSMREAAYQEVLSTLVTAETGDRELVDNYVKLKTDRRQMEANLEGQLVLVNQLKTQQTALTKRLNEEAVVTDRIKTRLEETLKTLEDSKAKQKTLAAEIKDLKSANGDQSNATQTAGLYLQWWWLALGGGVIGLLGAGIGFFIARGNQSDNLPQPASPTASDWHENQAEPQEDMEVDPGARTINEDVDHLDHLIQGENSTSGAAQK